MILQPRGRSIRLPNGTFKFGGNGCHLADMPRSLCEGHLSGVKYRQCPKILNSSLLLCVFFTFLFEIADFIYFKQLTSKE
jgi:hypothetical protein